MIKLPQSFRNVGCAIFWHFSILKSILFVHRLVSVCVFFIFGKKYSTGKSKIESSILSLNWKFQLKVPFSPPVRSNSSNDKIHLTNLRKNPHPSARVWPRASMRIRERRLKRIVRLLPVALVCCRFLRSPRAQHPARERECAPGLI